MRRPLARNGRILALVTLVVGVRALKVDNAVGTGPTGRARQTRSDDHESTSARSLEDYRLLAYRDLVG